MGIAKGLREIESPAAAAGRVVLIYAAFAALWIFASDTALEALVRDPAQWARAGMFKGLLFVTVTALLLYGLVIRLLKTTGEARRALAESETRFEATFEQAAVGIALVAPDGRYLRVNPKLCSIVGYTQDEFLAKTVRDITHPDDLDADLDQVRRILAREIDTCSLEKRHLRKDGGIVWIELTVALVHKTDGTPDYFISVIVDISARKAAEQSLAKNQAAALAEQRRAQLAALNLAEDAVAARQQAEAMAATLAGQVNELQRWQQAMVGREDRIIAVKREVNALLAELGQPPRYASPREEGGEK